MGMKHDFMILLKYLKDQITFYIAQNEKNGKLFINRYFVDKLVRQGIDFHTNKKGERIRLLSHESSQCKNGAVIGSEMGFLPDGKISRETYELKWSGSSLHYHLKLNDKTLLNVKCSKLIKTDRG